MKNTCRVESVGLFLFGICLLNFQPLFAAVKSDRPFALVKSKGKAKGHQGDNRNDRRPVPKRPGKGKNGGNGSENSFAGGHADLPPEHIHFASALIKSGDENWNVTGSIAGLFPVIINHQSEVMLFNVRIPATTPRQKATVRLNHHGWLAPSRSRVGIVKPTRERHEKTGELLPQRVRSRSAREPNPEALERWKGNRQLVIPIAADGTIAFLFHYGPNRHGQQIDVVVDGKRYRFELHLHHPDDPHSHH